MVATGAHVTPPPGALLVRVRVASPSGPAPQSWVRSLPRVPRGETVTITVNDPRLRRIPVDDLVSHGYRIVGVRDAARRTSAATVDLLVTAELIAAHPQWAARLRARAERAFDLSMGPVLRVLGDVVALHLAGRDQTGR